MIYNLGYVAYVDEKDVDDNPYDRHSRDVDEFNGWSEWNRGWEDARIYFEFISEDLEILDDDV